MFLALGALLVICWVVAFLVFHVAGFAIHVLLIGAVLSMIVHAINGTKKTT